jgi:hypothetical protein
MKIHRSPPRWRLIVRTLGRLLFRWAENNDDERIEHNGEGWLLRQALAAHVGNGTTRPFVLFDVGANVGLYSLLAVQEARRFGCGIEVRAYREWMDNYSYANYVALSPSWRDAPGGPS